MSRGPPARPEPPRRAAPAVSHPPRAASPRAIRPLFKGLQWATSFAEGSYYEGDCSQRSTIRFLTTGSHGMVSVIAKNRPNEYLSIKHIGVVNHGVDDTASDEVEAWAPAYDNYTLKEIDCGAELIVEMNVPPEYENYFAKTWPKALKAVKKLAETGGC